MTNLNNNAETKTNDRRRFLIQSVLGTGLSFLLPGMELNAARRRGKKRAKSFILLWLDGGASQLETWDPHPGRTIGGPTKAIPTKLPGLKIAEFFPRMAEQIESLSVIRSLVSKEGDHERGVYFLKTGFRPDPTLTHPSLGAVLTHELPDPSIEIPMHVSLCGSNWPARGGFLGDRFDAFKIFNPGRHIQNMKPRVGDPKRQKRRLKNLEIASEAFRQGRRFATARTLHQHTIERALAMMNSDQLKAFDLKQEPAAVLKAYGDSNFGRGCLVARRLIEQGVRAVEVTLGGFDSHANNFESHQKNGEILDAAFASLVNDLKQRDLFESTVLLAIGEFGRTPKINALDGRDHWPTGFSCLIGGGGVPAGVVIGATDPTGKKKQPEDPIEVADLTATLYHHLGVNFSREIMTPIGRPMSLSTGTPIAQLV